ncbi:MAG: geranylgeranyl reductase family protein [Gemmatimonadetes bacterium]|nr:geranylgeranyl reductase family protein [Gemmatimonadota bacterium]
MKTNLDLVVVGGGPAGATAALYARKHGLSVALLDRARFPRDKVCGDALSGKSLAILLDLGLLDKVRALPGARIDRVVFGSPRHVNADIDLSTRPLHDTATGRDIRMEGSVIRREIFDNFLFQEAKAAVDECREGFQVTRLSRRGGAVTGVTGRAEDGSQVEIRADLVLGCDGFGSIVARQTELYNHDSRHWVVAIRQYFENVEGLDSQIELHFVDEVIPGYFWAFPLENGFANIGIGMLQESMKERKVDLRKALEQVISRPPFAERFAAARPLEKPVGWNLPIGSTRRKAHADGVMLLGDAAGLIDPFTGEGIGNALYSAKFAIETAAEAKRAGDFSEAFLKRYEDRLWDSLGDELKTSTRMQNLGNWRPLLNFVIGKAARSERVRDMICAMIANAAPKEELTSPLFYLKLLFNTLPNGRGRA